MNTDNTTPTETTPTNTSFKPASFFDDDEFTATFNFTLPLSIHNKDLSTPFTVRSRLQLKNLISGERFFALHNNTLVQYDSETDRQPKLVLSITHSRVKYLKPVSDDSDHGFSLAKNGTVYEFFGKNKQVVDSWFEALKRSCVLSTFHDDYKAIKMIGRGSFAKVYLVESKMNGKQFAVKAFTKDNMNVSNKANAKPSMLNEIEIMRAVDHENVIKLHEVYETEKSIYLVLELIQGKSLYDYLKKATFRAEEGYAVKIINITRSLLDALSYLASKGIMHRDLKPDNILLDKGDKVKLVDFGLATFIDLDTYIFKKCGTPGYIAPEVFKYDEKDKNTFYNDRCDVFSVGCLLYYMLYGAPIFEAPTAPEILRKNRNFGCTSSIYDNLKKELNDVNSKQPKDAINLILELIEFDQHKRITALEAICRPYFIPVPAGMQRVFGTNEFMIEGLSRHVSNEPYSPCSPLKMHSRATYEQCFSPLTPLRLDFSEKDQSPLTAPKERFMKDEDSVYLDMGRPDITGRTDTIVNGSINNSLLMINRGESYSNCASPAFKSSFSNRNPSRTATKQYKGNGSNQSFLKAAIFRNMQKNNSEGARDDDSEINSPNIPFTREISSPCNVSPGLRLYDCNEVIEQAGQEAEEDTTTINQIHLNFGPKIERSDSAGHGKSQGDSNLLKGRRFQPFAKGNLIIPNNSVSGLYKC